MKQLKVTSLSELRTTAGGEVVELPSFIEGQPFIARVKRPSLLGLASSGLIPNSLLSVAHELFNGKTSHQSKDEPSFIQTATMFNIIAENALVEPSYAQLEEIGLKLTDMQLLAVFNYSQMGVRALESFRSVERIEKGVDAEPIL